MKRVILGNGEKYAVDNIYRGKPPGKTPNPYPFSVSSNRVATRVERTLLQASELPASAIPDDELVASLTLHPSFLAKSYYPSTLFSSYKLTSLGSKEVFVKPEKAENKEQATRPVSTSMYFISGKKSSFEKLLSDIKNNALNEDLSLDLGKIEDLKLFDSGDKVKSQFDEGFNAYEVVLHLGKEEKKKLNSFLSYVLSLGGECDLDRARVIDNLTFCFVKIESKKVSDLAKFSFVRVVRQSPKVNFSNSSVQELPSEPFGENPPNEFPNLGSGETNNGLDSIEPTVAVFDGGLFGDKLSINYLRYFDLTTSNDKNSPIYAHGELVTSAIMYGTVKDISSDGHEIIAVDHYKVFSEMDEDDVGLVDVLDRICEVLRKRKYKIVNISLGPEIPCPDDEPNLWTSTLDKIAADGSVLIVIAAGNAGAILSEFPEDHDLARIQPPADMLNGLSVGAADSETKHWKRANYSSIGPGRRPGYIKPDAVHFGGNESHNGEKVRLLGLYDYEEKQKFGTSFAAPLVTRVAARLDKMTSNYLTPATLRALLIHYAEKSNDRRGCGWGRIGSDVGKYIFCSNDEVTVIYQGELSKSSGVRAAIPCPDILKKIKTKVEMSATLCFFTDVDHNHPVSYSRAGIEVVFRPHSDKFGINPDTGEPSTEAKTRSLFNKKNILGNEQYLRRDSHKWETCYKVHDSFYASSIHEPSLDIKYLTRDEGQPLSPKDMKALPILHYSLVLTLKVKQGINLYDSIVNEYTLLQPIPLNVNQNVVV